ncbi:MAG: protein kinase, partial [Ruegeria sp.]
AMERVRGDDLLTVVDETPVRLTPRLIDKLLRDALQAIDYIPDMGILHRDISPDNFLLGPDEHLTMIDFGAAREHAGKENRALSALLAVKDGYSPHEFYLTDVDQTAASDLYSLGATFYHLITGEAPPNSQDRVAALAANQEDPYVGLLERAHDVDPNLSETLLLSVDQALEVLPRDRISSAREWLEKLDQIEDVCAEDADATPVDKDLTRTISRLVEDTNKDVNQGMPGDAAQMAQSKAKKKRAKARAEAEAEAAKPKQKVDIFGNPISNVEAWLKEQSKPKTRRLEEKERPMAGPRRTRLLRKPAEPEVEEPPEPPRKQRGRLRRLVSSYVPAKRASSTPMTTKGRPA